MVKYIVYCVALFRQVLLVADTLKLGGTVLSAIPDMLAAQLVARLVSSCTCTVYTSQHLFRTHKYNIDVTLLDF